MIVIAKIYSKRQEKLQSSFKFVFGKIGTSKKK